MVVASLRVQNFRNHIDTHCEFSPKSTLIYGKNGSGKTALLEAIYIAYRGVSFRGTDDEIIRFAQKWYRADVAESAAVTRTVLADNRTEQKIKRFVVDGKKSVRLPIKYKQPIILFTPDDLQLINGSPARRRKYLDTVISQYNPQYGQALRRYERALLQRNKLLKQYNVSRDALFSWDMILSQTGAVIIAAREQLIEYITNKITHYYRDIAGDTHSELMAKYSHSATPAPVLLAQYHASYDHDNITKTTSVGPHRHDFLFSLNSRPATDCASRGEIRTIILALKYIEANLVFNKLDKHPIVLLDDVFGELDLSRQKNLQHAFMYNQIIATGTDLHSGFNAAIKLS
ncbi:MAG: DNA replication and repair protein RecF [Candidatus Saccharimonas sp.]